jgi:hypothetical protein
MCRIPLLVTFDLELWPQAHCLEVVYLHAKHEKPGLNDKKVTARTRFAMDAQTSLTLRSKFKVTNNATRHIVWRGSTYMPNMKSLSWTTKKLQPSHDLLWTHGPPTHRLEVVYLHAKYAKPVLNDKKVTDARTDAQTDHYRASATLLRGPNKNWFFTEKKSFSQYYLCLWVMYTQMYTTCYLGINSWSPVVYTVKPVWTESPWNQILCSE